MAFTDQKADQVIALYTYCFSLLTGKQNFLHLHWEFELSCVRKGQQGLSRAPAQHKPRKKGPLIPSISSAVAHIAVSLE